MKLRVFFVVFIALLLGGCIARPSTQWWRVGNCLVIYDQTKDEKQLVAVGQNCDIKRDTISSAGDVK